MADSNVNQENAPRMEEHPFTGHDRKRHPWRFSEDELRVFEECKRESLLYRALPLATLFGVATYAAVKYGYLKPSVKFGPAPKVILATILGYGIGKFSYRKTCMKKMMALPNSRFGQFLRENRPWGGCHAREKWMMYHAGANPRYFYWGTGPLPSGEPNAEQHGEKP